MISLADSWGVFVIGLILLLVFTAGCQQYKEKVIDPNYQTNHAIGSGSSSYSQVSSSQPMNTTSQSVNASSTIETVTWTPPKFP